jgi:hypothetical protein
MSEVDGGASQCQARKGRRPLSLTPVMPPANSLRSIDLELQTVLIRTRSRCFTKCFTYLGITIIALSIEPFILGIGVGFKRATPFTELFPKCALANVPVASDSVRC